MHRKYKTRPHIYYRLSWGTPRLSGYIFRTRRDTKEIWSRNPDAMIPAMTYDPKLNIWKRDYIYGRMSVSLITKEEVLKYYPNAI